MNDSVPAVIRLHEHRCWVNQRLLQQASELSDEKLHQSFAIGQGSFWKTLTHLYAAEYCWLAAIQGDVQPVAPGDIWEGLPGNQLGPDAATSVAELQKRWETVEADWNSWLGELTPETLTQQVVKVSSLSGKASDTSILDIVLHVCTHAQYTVAQGINMLRQLGVTPLPDPMLITLARQQSVQYREAGDP